EGKVNAYFDQVCLCRQKFIKDDSMTIDQLVERRAKELGHPLRVAYFLRLQVGEGAVQ
ncbi:MAG: elongation factor Ts, partial [Chlamydiia bacterium]|nr:elongation factor Ts [Chlamydiia bacterium]